MGKLRSSAPLTCAAVMVIGLFLLTGCQSERRAKQVAAVRKSGKLKEAREMAVEELQKDPDEMSLWRELAATDLALCERPASSDIPAIYPALIEAALLCTAVYENGKMDEKWQTNASRTAAQTGTMANQILNEVEVVTERGRTHLRSEPLSGVELQSERFVDPADMEWTVKHAVPLIFFSRHLGPVLSKDFESNVRNLENRLEQIAENTNISEALLNDRRRVAEEKVTRGLDAASQDLKDSGSFECETIFHNPMLE
jgi:hypothetical protein